MTPFSAVGTILMGYARLSTRERDVKGSQGWRLERASSLSHREICWRLNLFRRVGCSSKAHWLLPAALFCGNGAEDMMMALPESLTDDEAQFILQFAERIRRHQGTG